MSAEPPARLAQVANYVGPSSGGLRVVVSELGRGHVAAGGTRLQLLPAPSDQVADGGPERLVGVRAPGLPGSRGAYRVLLRRRPVVRELEGFAPGLLEVHDQTTLAWLGSWAQRAGVPSVLVSHERLDGVVLQHGRERLGPWGLAGLEPAAEPVVERVGEWWAGRLAERFDAVVCASAYAAEPFLAAGARNVVRVPFGVDLEVFHPDAGAGDAWPWWPRRLRLVHVGRLWAEKAPGVALDVVARLAAAGIGVQLAMLGTGPLEESLRRRAAAERLPVHFLGHLADRRAVAAVVATADVALAPGPRETFGLAALEALACGTPVVVSDRGASREHLVPGAGAAAGTAEEMAAAVVPLVADPSSGARARRRAEQFGWAATCAAMADLRGRLAAQAQPASRRRPRLASNRSSRSSTSSAAHTRLRPPPETSVSTPASVSRSTAR